MRESTHLRAGWDPLDGVRSVVSHLSLREERGSESYAGRL